MAKRPGPARDAAIARELSAWFRGAARDLPWRARPLGSPRDPYAVLVSEVMLQQTQVSRVAERFVVFMKRFPDVRSLARASDDQILALWSGMGYYRRARLLRDAALAVVERFDSVIPAEVESLRSLPGVGRYTAGAIASLAFSRAEPLVDGNVQRVLMRIEGRPGPRDEAAQAWAWQRAADLVVRSESAAVLNEGLMELGASLCTPRAPACGACPIRDHCRARRAGLQERIPEPKRAASKKTVFATVLVLRGRDSRVLVRPRPSRGMWAGLWEAPTFESDHPTSIERIAASIGVDPEGFEHAAAFTHQTTHREVRFDVWERIGVSTEEGKEIDGRIEGARWRRPAEIAALALSSPQRRILLANTPAAIS